jgi:predicted nucleic acid-binding protein
MRFWDTSAVIPLIGDEPTSETIWRRLEEDPQILLWWGTPVEVVSALARREREGQLSADDVTGAVRKLRQLSDAWHEIAPSEAVRRGAERLLRVHPLRATDSLRLAAAVTAADYDPSTLEFVCLDDRLNAAARREGFIVIDG